MYTSSLLSALALALTLTICSVTSEETHQLEDADIESSEHQPQKRSAAILEPEVNSGLWETPYGEIPYFWADEDTDEPAKRSSLFRFGKRGGSLFRFGKRGSLFRFGKRGSLFRFGKRGGTLFRFGRSGPSDDLDEKRTMFRFGKRSDLDLVRDALESQGYPVYGGDARKRDADGFHWGEEQN